MKEGTIRTSFHLSVLKNAHEDSDTFVIDELGLRNGVSRADIAVLNGKMIGYEIKTENDNLTRLPSQVFSYTQIFDKSFIIVAEKHLENSIQIIPNWWGIYLISPYDEGYKFKQIRKAKNNKDQNSFSMAQLLWKDEAIDVANNLLGLNVKLKTPRHEIYEIISQNYTPKELSKIIIRYLKKRTLWRQNL